MKKYFVILITCSLFLSACAQDNAKQKKSDPFFTIDVEASEKFPVELIAEPNKPISIKIEQANDKFDVNVDQLRLDPVTIKPAPDANSLPVDIGTIKLDTVPIKVDTAFSRSLPVSVTIAPKDMKILIIIGSAITAALALCTLFFLVMTIMFFKAVKQLQRSQNDQNTV